MESTWEGRDWLVLEHIVGFYDEYGESPDPQDIAEMLGWHEQVEDEDDAYEDVMRALRAVEHKQPPLITELRKSADGDIIGIGAPTGHARRTVGAWPTPEALADRIVAALHEAAEQESDPEARSKLKRAAEAVGGVGKRVLTGVLTHVITQSA